MALEDNCTLWSKAENDASWTAPEIGPIGTITGTPIYGAAKFNNGSSAPARDQCKYPRITVMPDANKYIYDFWIKWKVSSALWSHNEWIAGDRIWNVKHGFLFGVMATTNWWLYKKDAGGDVAFINHAGETWNQNDLDWIMIVIDNTAGFDGAKTAAIYRNGVQIASSTAAFNITVLNTEFTILNYDGSLESTRDMYIDNFKMYNDISTSLITDIIANKDTEGWPVTGGFKMIDGGLQSNMIDGSVLIN